MVMWIFLSVVIFFLLALSLVVLGHLLMLLFVGIAFFSVWALVFFILMILDCAQRDFKKEEDKIVWLLIIIFTQIFGAIIYYYVIKKKDEKVKKKKKKKGGKKHGKK